MFRLWRTRSIHNRNVPRCKYMGGCSDCEERNGGVFRLWRTQRKIWNAVERRVNRSRTLQDEDRSLKNCSDYKSKNAAKITQKSCKKSICVLCRTYCFNDYLGKNAARFCSLNRGSRTESFFCWIAGHLFKTRTPKFAPKTLIILFDLARNNPPHCVLMPLFTLRRTECVRLRSMILRCVRHSLNIA